MRSTAIAIVVLSLAAASPALAQQRMYKCVDDKGKVYYTQVPPKECLGKETQELSRQGQVVKRNEEILRPIISKIQTILAKIGSEEGFDLILDAADGHVLYADQSLDLTQRVIDELNKQ